MMAWSMAAFLLPEEACVLDIPTFIVSVIEEEEEEKGNGKHSGHNAHYNDQAWLKGRGFASATGIARQRAAVVSHTQPPSSR